MTKKLNLRLYIPLISPYFIIIGAGLSLFYGLLKVEALPYFQLSPLEKRSIECLYWGLFGLGFFPLKTKLKAKIFHSKKTQLPTTKETDPAKNSYATLTRGLAHEIKNPLGMILSGIELIEENTENKAIILEYCKLIKENILRLSNITSTMIHYGSPISKQREPLNMNTLIEDICILSQKDLKKRNLTLTTELEATGFIQGEKNSLSQSLLNLVLNASQAITDTGSINIKTENSSIQTQDKKRILGIKITIRDTGCGIPCEIKSKIFDPFFSTKHRHTGLGLSLVLRVVEEHKGTIEHLDNTPQGSCFVLFLPTDPSKP